MGKKYTWNVPHEITVEIEEAYEFCYYYFDEGKYLPRFPEKAWYHCDCAYINDCTDYYADNIPDEILKQLGKDLREIYEKRIGE